MPSIGKRRGGKGKREESKEKPTESTFSKTLT
jgi:hypothetical protein